MTCMALASAYNYYLVISVALIQFAVLSSFMYQVFRESRRQVDRDVGSVRVNRSLSVSTINQLEFDYVSRSRESVAEPDELAMSINEDEAKVLSYLLNRGGDAYQAEIARELGLPKSTVSRIIRRLHDKGLITVRRVGKFSYVQVTDMDYVSDIISRLGLDESHR